MRENLSTGAMIEQLLKFGFTHKEAKVYLALLESGSALARDIAKQAGINRSTTYVILEALVQKGLAGIAEQDGIKKYNPTPPERMVQYLDDAATKYASLVGLARNLLPELKALYVGVGPKPKVSFYEGEEGLKTAYEDTLTSSETIRAYASIENMHKALPGYFPAYYQRRVGKNIGIRAIFPDTPESRERITHNAEEARNACLIPQAEYAFSPEINVYDNKIVFMSLVEKFALIIESRELADAFKKIFELSWREAQRFSRSQTKKK